MQNTIISSLFWICYIVTIIIGIEIFAYLWHRYGAHADYIPGIHDTHQIHHMIGDNNDESTLSSHEADEDFIWILLMMISFEIIIGLCVVAGIIPGIIAIVTIAVCLVVFWWNWWIHKAYHQKDHWLNSYEWFKLEKERHYVHHKYPDKNYGIATHFPDMLLGTWIDPSINDFS
jgi:sterol desaturase/sphingolipid hydroxylase (fatty acid hydroxylase superfamily)